MLIRFYCYGQVRFLKEFEAALIPNFAAGVMAHGDELEAVPATTFDGPSDADVAAFIGARGHSREINDSYLAVGKRVLHFDKGLVRVGNRSGGYCRICIDEPTPLLTLMRIGRSFDRWEQLGIKVHPRRRKTKKTAIVYAANSQKVHDYWGLGDSQALAKRTFADIRRLARKRPLIYRPKPRAIDFAPIKGVAMSLLPERIEGALENAHVLVTYTSNAAVNAILAGVPAVCLGRTASKPVAGKYLEQIIDPPFPDDERRMQWLANLAYCQWTDEEMRSGEAWAYLKGEMEATATP